MNLLHDEASDIAKRIMARLSHNGTSCVYVRPSGVVSSYSLGDVRNARCVPAFLVGTYNRDALASDIADDLRCRRREIAA